MTITKSSISFPNKGVEHLFLSLGSNHESVELEGETCPVNSEFFALEIKLNGRSLAYEELVQLGRSYGFVVAEKVTAYQVDEVPFDSLTPEQQEEVLNAPPVILEVVEEALPDVSLDDVLETSKRKRK